MTDLRGVRAVSATDKQEVLDRIFAAWIKAPQLRLGQLLEGALPAESAGVFYVEDWPLVAAVERLVEK